MSSLSNWDLENMLTAAVLGVLLMMYAEQRAARLVKHHPLSYAHLIVIYATGMVLLAKLVLALIATLPWGQP